MKGTKILALVLVVHLALSATGCVIERVSEREPEFSVVFCEDQLREYIRRARADEDNWDTLFREIVLEPIQQELRDRDSIINLGNYHQPISNLDALEEAIDLFMAMDITGVVEDALTKCNDSIQGVDTVVYILLDDPDDQVDQNERSSMKKAATRTGWETDQNRGHLLTPSWDNFL